MSMTWISKIISWFYTPHPAISNTANILGIIGALGVVSIIGFFVAKLSPTVTIHCPNEIRQSNHVVFGNYTPIQNHEVYVYVHPDDGMDNFWLQSNPSHSSSMGAWSINARFGNPYGKDHVKEPPLYFDVVAVLIPKDHINELPGMDENPVHIESFTEFDRIVQSAGVKKRAECRIHRIPEFCRIQPSIVFPKQPPDPFEYPKVYSPLSFKWDPQIPMYAELWSGGKPVANMSHQVMHYSQEVSLDPGIYELKIRQKKGAECYANVWFMVLQKDAGNKQP